MIRLLHRLRYHTTRPKPDEIVAILRDSSRPLRGVEIADHFHEIQRGAVYAVLAQLQRDGRIRAQWVEHENRPTRVFWVEVDRD